MRTIAALLLAATSVAAQFKPENGTGSIYADVPANATFHIVMTTCWEGKAMVVGPPPYLVDAGTFQQVTTAVGGAVSNRNITFTGYGASAVSFGSAPGGAYVHVAGPAFWASHKMTKASLALFASYNGKSVCIWHQ